MERGWDANHSAVDGLGTGVIAEEITECVDNKKRSGIRQSFSSKGGLTESWASSTQRLRRRTLELVAADQLPDGKCEGATC